MNETETSYVLVSMESPDITMSQGSWFVPYGGVLLHLFPPGAPRYAVYEEKQQELYHVKIDRGTRVETRINVDNQVFEAVLKKIWESRFGPIDLTAEGIRVVAAVHMILRDQELPSSEEDDDEAN